MTPGAATAPSPSCAYRFGRWELDPRAGQLTAAGAVVPLQDLPFRLLATLAEARGAIVPREELQRRLWPDKSFLDFEAGLNTAMRKLRLALEDDPRQPQCVGTLRGYGYRLLLPVEAVLPAAVAPAATVGEDAPSVAASPPPIPPRSASARARRVWLAPAAAALLALAALVWWLTPLPPPTVTRVLPITTSGALDFALHPPSDGARIYFIERRGDGWQAMQTSLVGGEAQPLGTPFNMAILDISPDGGRFLAGQIDRRGDPLALWTLPVQGGSPLRLGHLAALAAAWSHDGQWLAYTLDSQLWLARADGTQPRVIASLHDSLDWPVWAPDDLRISFTVRNYMDQSFTAWEVRPDGSHLRQLLAGWSSTPAEGLGSWSPDGSYFFFFSQHDGGSDLWALREHGPWWRRSPPGPFRLTTGPMSVESATMTSDGKRVYFFSQSQRWETQALDASGHLQPYLPAADVLGPSYSADGQWIVYSDNAHRLWRSRANGTDQRRLSTDPMTAWFPRWSPDARTIVFPGRVAGKPTMVYLVSRDGGEPEPLATAWHFLDNPDWSPDGKTILVTLPADNAHSEGPSTIAMVDVSSRRVRLLPGALGLGAARWSPDGRFIAASSADQRQLKLFEVASGLWRPVAMGKALGTPLWAPDGSVYFQDLLGPGEALFHAQAPDWRPRRVAEFSALFQHGPRRCALVGVMPNGTVLMMLSYASSNLYAAELRLPN